ncbi:Ig-like domain-containing protein [Clostridium cylindrosporum]|uniref:SbsA Ig-like domain-containing protein n=1 Tax=Clostridium cylindrosporum DSM 605 TaxID=1121307 RepID=A0A0J8G6X5_CLOCY|nr:Ig-like domain-containing protein [Clostridium cylindrosporum]KMT23341.1 hypothetical protein CLCY_8c00780 [Clostridium cylindrosporum DSM 605]
MIYKSKKVVGACLLSAMTLMSIASATQSISEVKVVKAGVREDSLAVHYKIEHLRSSLKKNYLGLKNVGQWQKYIKEARALNAKLPNGSTKTKYAERINTAEALVNAAARVNQLEFSMDKNAHVMANVPQWGEYVDLAIEDLEKVDINQYEAQYNSLVDRLEKRILDIYEILGLDIEIPDAVIEKATPDKITITFGEAIKSSESDIKDSIIVNVDNTEVAVKSAIISEDGLSISITLNKPVTAGQAVTVTLKEDGSIEDKNGNGIYTDIPVEVDNLL